MNLYQAIIFGIVQGATEFLPISSTAHLILLPWFLNWEDPGLAFDVALHFGTLLSLLCCFRTEWIDLCRSFVHVARGRVSHPHGRLGLFIIVATIPGALAGALGEDFIESRLRSPLVISFTLIALALVLVAAEVWGRRQKDIDHLSWSDVVVIGLAQTLALVPGVSRAGITITAGLLRGLKRDAAARFSFILAMPLIAGAAVKESYEIIEAGFVGTPWPAFVVGIVVSAIVGYAAIRFLLRYLQANTLYIFVYYRIALGLIIFLAFWSGFR